MAVRIGGTEAGVVVSDSGRTYFEASHSMNHGDCVTPGMPLDAELNPVPVPESLPAGAPAGLGRLALAA